MSLRDEEPSQTALILVSFNPGLSPVAPSGQALGSHIGVKHQTLLSVRLRNIPTLNPNDR
jgi:hypothetical protein